MPFDEYGNFVPYNSDEDTMQFSEEDVQVAQFLDAYVPSFVADIVHNSNGVVLSEDEAYALGEEMVKRLDANGISELVDDISAAYFSEDREADNSEETFLAFAEMLQQGLAEEGMEFSDEDVIELATAVLGELGEDYAFSMEEAISNYMFEGDPGVPTPPAPGKPKLGDRIRGGVKKAIEKAKELLRRAKGGIGRGIAKGREIWSKIPRKGKIGLGIGAGLATVGGGLAAANASQKHSEEEYVEQMVYGFAELLNEALTEEGVELSEEELVGLSEALIGDMDEYESYEFEEDMSAYLFADAPKKPGWGQKIGETINKGKAWVKKHTASARKAIGGAWKKARPVVDRARRGAARGLRNLAGHVAPPGVLKKAGRLWKKLPKGARTGAKILGAGGALAGAAYAGNQSNRLSEADAVETPMTRRRTAAKRLQQLGYGTQDGLFF